MVVSGVTVVAAPPAHALPRDQRREHATGRANPRRTGADPPPAATPRLSRSGVYWGRLGTGLCGGRGGHARAGLPRCAPHTRSESPVRTSVAAPAMKTAAVAVGMLLAAPLMGSLPALAEESAAAEESAVAEEAAEAEEPFSVPETSAPFVETFQTDPFASGRWVESTDSSYDGQEWAWETPKGVTGKYAADKVRSCQRPLGYPAPPPHSPPSSPPSSFLLPPSSVLLPLSSLLPLLPHPLRSCTTAGTHIPTAFRPSSNAPKVTASRGGTKRHATRRLFIL